MVAELDITDQDVTKLANMIDNEIATLVPGWKPGPIIEEISENSSSASFCLNCATNNSLFDCVSSNNIPSAKNLQFFHCSKNGCAAVHGRFEEITYQFEGPGNSAASEGAPAAASSQSNGIHYADIWAQRDELELTAEGLKDIHCDIAHEASNLSTTKENERTVNLDGQSDVNIKKPPSTASECVFLDHENDIRQELRWLKARYQMQIRELRDHQLGVRPKSNCTSPDTDDKLSPKLHLKMQHNNSLLRSMAYKKHFPVDVEKCNTLADQMIQNVDVTSPEQIITAKDFFAGALLPHSLQRATSLPVDAVDV